METSRGGVVWRRGVEAEWPKRRKPRNRDMVQQCGVNLRTDQQGAYAHTPSSPTAASIAIWEQASEALLEPDMTIGYEPKGMEEFAGRLSGGSGVRAWLRGWVEGRNLVRL